MNTHVAQMAASSPTAANTQGPVGLPPHVHPESADGLAVAALQQHQSQHSTRKRSLVAEDGKVLQQLTGALKLLSESTRCASRVGELRLKCPELADLMTGVLEGQLSDQATAQQAIAVITQFASEQALDIQRKEDKHQLNPYKSSQEMASSSQKAVKAATPRPERA